jgi:hypothetical protein
VDLGDAANYAPGTLEVVFANNSLRSNPALYEAVRGRESAVSPRTDLNKGFAQFRSWILSAAVNGESLDVCLPPFVHGGVSWSCSTLRKRLRVASASAAISSPNSSSSLDAPSLPLRMPCDAPLTTSTSSFNRLQQEPDDYFGDVAPDAAAPTVKSGTADEPAVFSSIGFHETPSSSHAETTTTSANGAKATIAADSVSPGSRPSLTSKCALSAHAAAHVDGFCSPSLEDIGFFDWTRLPYSENLPRHIKFARSIDWAATSVGPIELWPPDLRQMCNLIMASPHPAGKRRKRCP